MNYDEALSKFLETYESDEIFSNYFIAIRKAFIAGYRAANGEIQVGQKVNEIESTFRQAGMDLSK